MIERKVSGEYTIEVISQDGSVKVGLNFPNLITDGGLSYLGEYGNPLSIIAFGSGTASPSFSDTSLTQYVGETSRTISVNDSSTDDYYQRQVVFQSNPGQIVGNLSEVGIYTQPSGVWRRLYSKSLIKDALGDPTTISVLPDEVIRATYTHRTWFIKEITSGTFELEGNLGGSYEFTAYPILNHDNYITYSPEQTENKTGKSLTFYSFIWSAKANIEGVYDSTTVDAGYYIYESNPPSSRESSGNSLTWTYTLGLDNHNHPEGIGYIQVHQGCQDMRYLISPPIMKTKDDIVSLNFTHSWGRK